MASSGSFNTESYSGRYLKFEWSIKSQSVSDNKTVINWSLTGAGGSTTSYIVSGNFKVVINGSTVYSSSKRIHLYNGTKVASGTATIYHNSDGSKTFSASAQAGIYTVAVNCEGSGSWSLTKIPRGFTSTPAISKNSNTETTYTWNWETSETCSKVVLYLDGKSKATWTGSAKSGTITATGLTPGTTYDAYLVCTRKDTGITSNSKTKQYTTLNYPYCNDSPNFVIGNNFTLKFYNPLNRNITITIIANGIEITPSFTTSGTSYTISTNTNFENQLYATIPNTQSAKYKVKVVYSSNTNTRDNGNTFSINSVNCSPTFNEFTYKDSNESVTSITGNNQILVKGLSLLEVTIPSINKMIALKSATPKNYVISADILSKTVNYSENDIVANLGSISSAGTKRLNVRAYDSRDLSTLVYKDITVYDYTKPVVNVEASRLNDFEAETTLKVSGTFDKLNIDGTDKNTITLAQYRYREVEGEWSSWTTLIVTIQDNKYTCDDVILSLDNSKQFEFDVQVFDKLNSNNGSASIDVGEAIFFISTNKKQAYVGDRKVLTDTNEIEENSDLNDYKDTGYYFFNENIEISNIPVSGDGWLEVISTTIDKVKQFWHNNDYQTYVRTYNNGTWSDWQRQATLNDVYPIGSIYMSINSTNPSSLFGGTWKAWGAGRVPVGIDTSQTEFNKVEKTGGEKTHKLTEAELASHIHTSNDDAAGYFSGWGNKSGDGWVVASAKGKGGNYVTKKTGGDRAHNNLQPYIVCYMWVRTA